MLRLPKTDTINELKAKKITSRVKENLEATPGSFVDNDIHQIIHVTLHFQ
jgi:hypothetical protein